MTDTLTYPERTDKIVGSNVEHGDFALDAEKREVRGLLVPWGEKSRLSASKTEPIAFERGTVAVPRDVSVVGANRRHDRFDPVARATSIEDTERGLVGVFAIANTDEGDALIRDHAEGKLRKLSPELAGIVRDAKDHGRGISARLVGAGFVEEGAFASAGLFALGDITDAETVEAEVGVIEFTPVDGRIEVVATETPEVVVVTVEDRPTEFTPTPTPDAPAETERATMAVATAPNTAQITEEKKPLDANGVFELITAIKGGTETEDMLAALADIKISGTGALPATGVVQPAWLGEVWPGIERARRYVSLIKNGPIVALEEKGFKLSTGSELVQSWNGNKTELPTGTATTSLVSGEALQKWGFAADIAREFYDIPAGQPIVAAFIREILRSYARVTDKYALTKIVAGAGAAIQADVYPTGYPTSLGKLVQGIDLVDDSDVSPTFAVVAPDVWKELRYTPFEKIPQYINFSFGRQDGDADGVTVVRDKAGVLAAGQVLVGSKDAAHINEIGGDSPIQLDALDLARGGIDRAVLGYSQYMTEYPDGLRLIGNRA